MPLGAPWDAWGLQERDLPPGLRGLVRLCEAQARLWLDPLDCALVDASPALDPVLGPVLQDPELGPRLRLALAGDRRPLDRRQELLALLAGEAALALQEGAWEAALGRARRGRLRPSWREFVEGFAAGHRYLRSARLVRGWAASARPRAGPPGPEQLLRTMQAAAAFVLRPGGLRSAWELQRWGVGEHRGPLVSRWFQEGILLQGLHEAGFDQAKAIRALLDSLPEELRWYCVLGADDTPREAGGCWRGIPPDADSLGLMLQLDALVGGLAPGRAAGWRAFLHASLGTDGRIPTWFYTAPGGGPSIEGPAWEYADNDCTTARATALLGLLLHAHPQDEACRRRNAEIVLAAFAGSLDGGDARADSFYYPPAYAELVFLRLAAAWARLAPADALGRELAETARRLGSRILARQDPDGGFGGDQDTGLRLEALCLVDAPVEALARGLRALDERQRPDGAWQSAPFYLMPGKDLGRIAWHQASEYATLFCLRAVGCAMRRVHGH